MAGGGKSRFAGKATDDPVLMALGDAQSKFKIPAELFEKLVYGTSLDLDIPPASAESPAILCNTFEDLKQYCYYVASMLGWYASDFWLSGHEGRISGRDCGLAFQLTNIIRDVKKTRLWAHLYTRRRPGAQHLTSANFASSVLQDPAQAQQLRPALEYEAERARKYYESGKWLMELMMKTAGRVMGAGGNLQPPASENH